MKNYKKNILTDDVTIEFNCNFDSLLLWANSIDGKNNAYRINKNLLVAKYPLTKNYLLSYYDSSNFYLKKYDVFKNRDCAAHVYNYFVQTFGKSYNTQSGASPGGAGKAETFNTGLNPFFGFINLNIAGLPGWLWLALLAGIYVVVKE